MASTQIQYEDESFARIVGRRLRVFRIEADLSQSKLARRIDVSDATIQRIEAGKDTTTTTIQAVLDELGRTAEELLGSSPTPPYRRGKGAAPPTRHLEVVPDPASSGVLPSQGKLASALGRKAVASQLITVECVTTPAKRPRSDAPRRLPPGRR